MTTLLDDRICESQLDKSVKQHRGKPCLCSISVITTIVGLWAQVCKTKFSLLSLTQLLAFGIFSLRLKDKGAKILDLCWDSFHPPQHPHSVLRVVPTLWELHSTQIWGRKGTTWLSFIPTKCDCDTLHPCSYGGSRGHLGSCSGHRNFLGKVVSSLTLLHVCPAPFLL